MSKTIIGVGALISLGAGTLVAQKTEIRFGGTILGTQRNVALDSSNISRLSGTSSGGEFVARGSGGGIMLRYAHAGFPNAASGTTQKDLTVADGRVFLGPQAFAVELGYMRRSQSSGLFNDPGEHLALLGARSVVSLGPSGFAVSFAGQAIGRLEKDTATVRGTGSSGKAKVAGWTLETRLLYQAPRRLPFFAMIGYRFERFRHKKLEGGLSEESSGVLIGAGLRLVRF